MGRKRGIRKFNLVLWYVSRIHCKLKFELFMNFLGQLIPNCFSDTDCYSQKISIHLQLYTIFTEIKICLWCLLICITKSCFITVDKLAAEFAVGNEESQISYCNFILFSRRISCNLQNLTYRLEAKVSFVYQISQCWYRQLLL